CPTFLKTSAIGSLPNGGGSACSMPRSTSVVLLVSVLLPGSISFGPYSFALTVKWPVLRPLTTSLLPSLTSVICSPQKFESVLYLFGYSSVYESGTRSKRP